MAECCNKMGNRVARINSRGGSKFLSVDRLVWPLADRPLEVQATRRYLPNPEECTPAPSGRIESAVWKVGQHLAASEGHCVPTTPRAITKECSLQPL